MERFLTEADRESLRTQHKQERDGRIRDRIKAVLLYDEGWTLEEVAHALLLTNESIRKHIKDYKASKKLKTANGGSNSKLTDTEQEETASSIMKCTEV